jgi:hypothetical protein
MNCQFLQRDGGRCSVINEHCEPLLNERRDYDHKIPNPSCPNNDPIWQMIQRCWKIVGRWTESNEKEFQKEMALVREAKDRFRAEHRKTT